MRILTVLCDIIQIVGAVAFVGIKSRSRKIHKINTPLTYTIALHAPLQRHIVEWWPHFWATLNLADHRVFAKRHKLYVPFGGSGSGAHRSAYSCTSHVDDYTVRKRDRRAHIQRQCRTRRQSRATCIASAKLHARANVEVCSQRAVSTNNLCDIPAKYITSETQSVFYYTIYIYKHKVNAKRIRGCFTSMSHTTTKKKNRVKKLLLAINMREIYVLTQHYLFYARLACEMLRARA